MTAERVIIAHQLKTHVDSFVKRFATCKRRRDRVEDWKAIYCELLGSEIVDRFSEDIEQVMPQCSIFVCGTIFRDFVDFQQKDPTDLPPCLNLEGDDWIREHLNHILQFAKANKSRASKSWPSLLKSNSFFERVCGYIQGIRRLPYRKTSQQHRARTLTEQRRISAVGSPLRGGRGGCRKHDFPLWGLDAQKHGRASSLRGHAQSIHEGSLILISSVRPATASRRPDRRTARRSSTPWSSSWMASSLCPPRLANTRA